MSKRLWFLVVWGVLLAIRPIPADAQRNTVPGGALSGWAPPFQSISQHRLHIIYTLTRELYQGAHDGERIAFNLKYLGLMRGMSYAMGYSPEHLKKALGAMQLPQDFDTQVMEAMSIKDPEKRAVETERLGEILLWARDQALPEVEREIRSRAETIAQNFLNGPRSREHLAAIRSASQQLGVFRLYGPSVMKRISTLNEILFHQELNQTFSAAKRFAQTLLGAALDADGMISLDLPASEAPDGMPVRYVMEDGNWMQRRESKVGEDRLLRIGFAPQTSVEPIPIGYPKMSMGLDVPWLAQRSKWYSIYWMAPYAEPKTSPLTSKNLKLAPALKEAGPLFSEMAPLSAGSVRTEQGASAAAPDGIVIDPMDSGRIALGRLALPPTVKKPMAGAAQKKINMGHPALWFGGALALSFLAEQIFPFHTMLGKGLFFSVWIILVGLLCYDIFSKR